MTTLKVFAKKILPRPALLAVRKAREKLLAPDHSQAGETRLLRNLVNDFECQRWIIDVGANDGITISNSFPFVKLGWRAILIEPAPLVFKKLTANCGHYDNVLCLQVACCDKPGEGNLYFGSDGEDGFMSTLCTSENEWFNRHRGPSFVRVKTDSLTGILERYHAPDRPGILLVDCEGMDYEVLLGLDFRQFRPTIIVTEEYEWEPEKHAAKYGLLIRARYSLVQKVGCNTFWIDRAAEPRHERENRRPANC